MQTVLVYQKQTLLLLLTAVASALARRAVSLFGLRTLLGQRDQGRRRRNREGGEGGKDHQCAFHGVLYSRRALHGRRVR